MYIDASSIYILFY